ncbi:MAG: hypothetical protein LC687_03405, partial [Actinobacteria bacterium]|nr:hypothetical protein [Actinomycetota bacterium]
MDYREFSTISQDEVDLYNSAMEWKLLFRGLDPDVNPLDTLLFYHDPLVWYRNEMVIKTKLFGLESENASIERAFVAAADIERELGMFKIRRRSPNARMVGGYLTQHHQCDMPIVFDTGASFSVTPVREDFVADLTPAQVKQLKGLTDSALVEGTGWVEWTIRDVFGRIHMVRTMAYYVP